jgi:hypothetical protein
MCLFARVELVDFVGQLHLTFEVKRPSMIDNPNTGSS